MRTATRKSSQHTRHSRKSSIIPALKLNGNRQLLRKMHLPVLTGETVSKLYTKSMKTVRRKPYKSLGAAIALSTAAGLLIWMLKK